MAVAEYLTVPYLNRKTIARIFSKIEIDRQTGCWNWTAALNTYGYSQVWYLGRDALTHRLLYAWLVAPLQRGHGKHIPQIDHAVCKNRRCCNPSHLEVVTPQVNQLRSNSVSGYFARQTHCKRGHLFPSYRNRTDGKGRVCVICASDYHRVAAKNRYLARKAARQAASAKNDRAS